MTRAIYNTNWYLLGRPEQRSLQLILIRSQKSVELTALTLLPLNVETFVDVGIQKCKILLSFYYIFFQFSLDYEKHLQMFCYVDHLHGAFVIGNAQPSI